MQHKVEKRLWYKQFWPWFLIAFPLSSMVLSFTMMKLAFTGKDSLVIDDYYKEGRSINLNLHKFQEAKVRDIEAQLLFGSNKIELVIIKGNLDDGSALTLDFFHSTQASKDFKTVLLKDASGKYTGTFDQDLAGKWRISLHPHDELWKIQQLVSLPQSEAVDFKP
jgi:hypothetical protein